MNEISDRNRRNCHNRSSNRCPSPNRGRNRTALHRSSTSHHCNCRTRNRHRYRNPCRTCGHDRTHRNCRNRNSNRYRNRRRCRSRLCRPGRSRRCNCRNPNRCRTRSHEPAKPANTPSTTLPPKPPPTDQNAAFSLLLVSDLSSHRFATRTLTHNQCIRSNRSCKKSKRRR